MSGDPVEKVLTAEAWTEFCDLLKKAGEIVLREDLATTAFERGEGIRYLSRLLRAGLQTFAENTGPKHPVFRALPDMVKMGLDNPDNYYLGASVSSKYSYRIRGTRGSIHYLSFAAQSQNFAAKDRIGGGAGHLEDSELIREPDGSFEIVASQEKRPGNWLRMNPDTTQILVRQTFLDRAKERPVQVEIECLEAAGPLAPLDPARVPGQLMGAAMYTIGASQWFADWVLSFRDKAPMNQFHKPDPEDHRRMGGDPNVIVLLGLWSLAPDEALVVEATPPKCDYWNFQLGNMWAESLDYRFRRTHVNSGNAALRRDGSFQLVVAHQDPGVPNWIDTAGHDHGIMGLRWVRADASPLPTCRVVKTPELKELTAER
jgi:hypothetical protein